MSRERELTGSSIEQDSVPVSRDRGEGADSCVKGEKKGTRVTHVLISFVQLLPSKHVCFPCYILVSRKTFMINNIFK